ncbi:hypothetical protein LHJ74_14720 [Streptomyces sp. N2-109]|uniref:Uncharacterized protein n=1 Tax=Streptomyces gossypii TaxID=2883101 RepID=A0ABT2JUW7_9ACTN|nr:hypothetical protein [Streptomyces gossypii]MCT2591145.1 hypothetical protein [Streptomyces gossypii]
MEALGRTLNVVPTADGVYANARDCSAVTFVCTGADTYTITEATDAAGTGAQSLVVVDHYYANTSAAGAAAWTHEEQTAAAAVTIAAGVAVIEVSTKALSDGFTHLACASTAAGLVTAVTSDLAVQRAPQNLPAVAA